MIATPHLGLSEQDMHIVRKILSVRIPDCRVYAFGSRATGHARRRSDLDLAVEGPAPLSLLERALLNEEFHDSDLPVRVDIVDLASITREFRQRIERDFVMVQESVAVSEVVA